jgi:Acetyltransferases, including N-acetylases of ribosomal proteins
MNITVRHARPEDSTAVHHIFMSDHVLRGTMRVPYQPVETTQKRLAPSDDIIKLVACVEDEVVGYAELITYPDAPRHRHAGEINMIAVHADWQGKGVGRTLMEAILDLADNWLQLRRLSLTVWKTNETAMQLYRKCGFALEGTLEQFVFSEGEYIDAYLMARIKR